MFATALLRELVGFFINIVLRDAFLSRFGGDLLSHTLRCSTIGATALNGRVREGIGCFARAMTTKPRKKRVRYLLAPAQAVASLVIADHQVESNAQTSVLLFQARGCYALRFMQLCVAFD